MTVALLSGGLDSTVAAYQTGATRAVFIDYGQRHLKEWESAQTIAHRLGIPLHRVNLRGYGSSVSSALTDPTIPVPRTGYDDAEGIATTEVPNRNAVFLSVAAGIAASFGHTQLVTGVHGGDHHTYPDTSPDFIAAIDHATIVACGVHIVAPFTRTTKAAIVAAGAELGVPMGLTWSCYLGSDLHCGVCGTCRDRHQAFIDAQITDPTTYHRETPC